MTPEQESQLLETVTATNVKMNLLISDDGSHGLVPEQKLAHAILESAVVEQGKQISYWKGGIAVVSFIILVFGVVLLTHILGGVKP
jgi:hypothetical protein